MVVLGMDPSLANFGFALVAMEDGKFTILEHDVVSTKASTTRSRRLREIRLQAAFLFDVWSSRNAIDAYAVEGGFVGIGAQTSLGIAEARGAALTAVPYTASCTILSPKTAKMALTGNGCSPKEDVMRAVLELTGYGALITADESDAAAVAIAAMQYRAPKVKLPRKVKQ